MRTINWEEPLSDEDREWAMMRADTPTGFGGLNYAGAVAANDAKFGKGGDVEPVDPSERIAELRSVIAGAQNEIQRLEVEHNLVANPNLAVQGDPSVGLVLDNTGVDGQRPEGSPEPKETYSDTTYWIKARLIQEIESRNPDRVAAGLEPLATSGNRAELVERLQRDDKELAEAEDAEPEA